MNKGVRTCRKEAGSSCGLPVAANKISLTYQSVILCRFSVTFSQTEKSVRAQ